MPPVIVPVVGPPEPPIDPRDLDAVRRRMDRRARDGDRDGVRVLADLLIHSGERTTLDRARARRLDGEPRSSRSLDLVTCHRKVDAGGDQDRILGKVFEMLWPAVLSIRGKVDREVGIHRRYEIDPDRTTITLARCFGLSARALGLDTPRLFLRPDVAGGVAFLPVYPVASLAGSTLLSGYAPAEVLFMTAFHLAWYRGGAYLATLLPSVSELASLVRAVLVLDGAMPPSAVDRALVSAIAPKLVPAQREALRLLLAHLQVPDAGSLDRAIEIAVTRWRTSQWLTANRAGLLLAQRLDPAVRMLRATGPMFPGVSVETGVEDLLAWASSRAYVEARHALGLDR